MTRLPRPPPARRARRARRAVRVQRGVPAGKAGGGKEKCFLFNGGLLEHSFRDSSELIHGLCFETCTGKEFWGWNEGTF